MIFFKYDFAKYIENKLNRKQINIESIFDTIDIDDNDLKNLALIK